MRAIDFIRELNITYPGMIAGSYALSASRFFLTAYNDIDFYTAKPVPKSVKVQNKKGEFIGEYIEINGKKFTKDIPNTEYKESSIASFKCDRFDDVPVNIIFVKSHTSPTDVLESFDLSVAQAGLTGWSDFDKVDISTQAFKDTDRTRVVTVVGDGKKVIDIRRVLKYMQKLPNTYTFKITGDVDLQLIDRGEK